MWTSVLIVVKSGVPMAALNLRRPLKYRLMLKYSVLELFLKRSRPQKVLNLAGASKMSDGSRIKADSNRLNIYCLVVQYIGILWIVGLFSRGKRPRIVLCWTLST